MKKLKIPQQQRREDDSSPPRRVSIGRIAYTAFLCVMMAMMFCQPAFAATDVWTKAKEIMQDVYTQILAISTIAAIVTASVALLLMNFSRSGRTVDESRAYYLGRPQWSRIHHGLCDASVLWWSVDRLMAAAIYPLEGGVSYGYPGWHR